MLKTRILLYFLEFHLLRFSAYLRGLPPWKLPTYTAAQKKFLKKAFNDLFSDTQNLPPSRKLTKHRIAFHIQRLLSVYKDLPGYLERKASERFQDFTPSIENTVREFPSYSRLNYHFQTDGYHSLESAGRYDHQIELLFFGTAELIRQRAYLLVKDLLPENPICLEFGSGTGSSGDQFRALFPQAQIHALDSSQAYLDHSEVTYPGLFHSRHRTSIESLDSNTLPKFDLVWSCFTLHEIPVIHWHEVFQRVRDSLKPEGLFLILDSQQDDDGEEPRFALDHFQKDFFEPYYPEYRRESLARWLSDHHFEVIRSQNLLLSKALLARKRT